MAYLFLPLSDTDDDQVWVAMAHEALLTWWRPLNTATTDIIIALRTARAMEQTATARANAGRPEHFLWDDKQLTTTLRVTTLGDSRVNQACPDSPITTRQ